MIVMWVWVVDGVNLGTHFISEYEFIYKTFFILFLILYETEAINIKFLGMIK